MKIIDKNISTFGLLTELTKSQTDNFEIIKNHWKKFNAELKKYNLIQKGGNWEKYGITIKTNEKYFYLTTIPQSEMIFSRTFCKQRNSKRRIRNIYSYRKNGKYQEDN